MYFRWIGRRCGPTRIVLSALLGVYALIFVMLNLMDIPSPGPSVLGPPLPVKTVSNPFASPLVEQKGLVPTQGGLLNSTSIYPAPAIWEHSIVDGSSSHHDGGELWEKTNLPPWMKEYFEWHKEIRAALHANSSHCKDIRYYIVECSENFNRCGGTADRLGPIPLHLRLAARFQRLLLISWRDDRPAPLETFLLPPVGGIDWRLPKWLLAKFLEARRGIRMAVELETILKFGPKVKVPWLLVKYQTHDHGRSYYDSQRLDANDPTYAQAYHDLWRILFTPAPPIAEKIEEQMHIMRLLPGRYVSTHLRALYGLWDREKYDVRWWARDFVNCATTEVPPFAPGETKVSMPILFVSDSTIATEEASSYGRKTGIKVLHRQHNGQQPLHLEKNNATIVSEFFDIFVDLLMIGLGRCTVYGMGGYGRLGSMISYNSSCVFHIKVNTLSCPFTKKGRRQDVAAINVINSGPNQTFFLPAMGLARARQATTSIDEFNSSAVNTDKKIPPFPFNFSELSYKLDDSIYDDPLLYETYDSEKHGTNIWEEPERLPVWMKKYFKWHKRQRRLFLNPENWKSLKILVMECHRTQPKCGGTSDRLKPLPTLVRIAASTDRLLLIHWTRPARLEEFLLPPKGGVDWRVPDWLHPLLIDYGEAYTYVDDIRDAAKSEAAGIRAKYQSYDGGKGWYNENLARDESDFNEVFHDVWKVFFAPSPPVARAIKNEMVNKGLAPGEYVAAHLRALYAQEARSAGQTKIWTRNAVNCCSILKPGKPIFFSSDSKIASDYSVAYGAKVNGTVVTHTNHPDPPLHLDRAENFSDTTVLARRPVADYYDTFTDLYLIALGQCVYQSKGGYGHWGLLIGGNTSCTMRFKRNKKGIQNPCNWTLPSDGVFLTRSELRKPLFLEPKR